MLISGQQRAQPLLWPVACLIAPIRFPSVVLPIFRAVSGSGLTTHFGSPGSVRSGCSNLRLGRW